MKRFLMISLVGGALAMMGCNGPSLHGKEMRKEAYSRMDAVNAQMVHKQAVSAFETGQLERARTLMAAAIDRYPEEPTWFVLLGRILMEQHRLDEARRSFEHAIQLGESSSEVRYYLGVLYERWSDDDKAVEYFSQAVEADAGRPQYVLAWAEALIAVGEVDQAFEVVAERMDHFEHHAGLRHLQGHCEMLRGNYDHAVAACEAALLLAPEDQGMMTDLVHMMFASGQWGNCLTRLENIKQLRGQLPPALQRLEVRVLMALGRSTKARSTLKLLCEASPDDAGLWHEYGLLAWDVGDWDGLARSVDRLELLEAFPCDRELFRALIERREGHWPQAAARLERLVEQFPDRPAIWAVLSTIRHRMGDFDGSEKARDIVVKWASNSADGTSVSGVYGTHGP
ncbi:MAG TPA: tetratricopeptide repeat protein [Phycisphaerales bacterium]|nr:tetratricopeptide repeat protein [Phycisphaerales bacterium]